MSNVKYLFNRWYFFILYGLFTIYCHLKLHFHCLQSCWLLDCPHTLIQGHLFGINLQSDLLSFDHCNQNPAIEKENCPPLLESTHKKRNDTNKRKDEKKQKTSMIGVEIKAAFLKRRLTPSAWFSLQNDEWKFISNHFARFVPPRNHIHLEELFIVLLLSSLKFSHKGFHCNELDFLERVGQYQLEFSY